jgi:hypothetical protein
MKGESKVQSGAPRGQIYKLGVTNGPENMTKNGSFKETFI